METDNVDIRNFIKLLTHINTSVITASLHLLCKIASDSDKKIQDMLGFSALSHMGLLLIHPEEEVKKPALTFLTKITASKDKSHRQAVIKAELMPRVIENFVKGDSGTKNLAAIVINNLTFEPYIDYIKQLIQNDVMGSSCELSNCIDDTDMNALNVSILYINYHNFYIIFSINKS